MNAKILLSTVHAGYDGDYVNEYTGESFSLYDVWEDACEHRYTVELHAYGNRSVITSEVETHTLNGASPKAVIAFLNGMFCNGHLN